MLFRYCLQFLFYSSLIFDYGSAIRPTTCCLLFVILAGLFTGSTTLTLYTILILTSTFQFSSYLLSLYMLHCHFICYIVTILSQINPLDHYQPPPGPSHQGPSRDPNEIFQCDLSPPSPPSVSNLVLLVIPLH